MSEVDKKFASKAELEDWLKISRGVDEDDAADAADKLFEKQFNKPSRLFGVTVDILQGVGIEDALAVELVNKLKDVDGQTRFRYLLKRAGISSVDEVLMNVVVKHFASNALVVSTPGQAKDLYYEASMLPRSATQAVLQERGISVAEVFRGSHPSKAVLLYAHERGKPRILKVANQLSIQREMEVWNAVAPYNEQKQNSTHLVPLRLMEFESAHSHLEIGDILGGASVQYPNTLTRSGF